VTQQGPHDVLSECLERWESGQGGAEELLARRPELRAELEPLLRLAEELRSLPAVRAPERLRRDPLWRRGLARPAEPSAPVALPAYAAARLEAPEALATALERWERGEPGVDAILAQHPDLEPLLALAVELRSLPPVQAPARLRQDPLWRRAAAPAAATAAPSAPVSLPLWAAARREHADPATRPAATGRTPRKHLVRTLSRLAAGVGGAGLALLLAGSLATSTATSLPDEPLYPVKRLVEDAQLAVAPPQARLEIRMQRAQERMKETREMVERDRADVVASLATDYVREVDAVRSELNNTQGQAPAPEQVGRVITRLEANEQMLGAIVQRVPEPARPAVARAVEVSRPDSVATGATAAAPAPVPAAVAAPVEAAPEPAAVAPPAVAEPAPPERIVPAAAPTFGVVGPASVALPGRSQVPQSTTSGAPAAEPRRVTIPGGAGAAPAILPSAGSTTPQHAPAATTGGTSAGATGSAGAVTTGSPDSAASGTGAVTGSSPSAGPSSTTVGAPAAPSLGTASGAATGGSPSVSAPTGSGGRSAGPASAPGAVTTGAASPSTAAGPASTTGSSGTAGGAGPTAPASTQRAPSFDAPPAQATPAASPTPIFQLLPPAATPTRTAP